MPVVNEYNNVILIFRRYTLYRAIWILAFFRNLDVNWCCYKTSRKNCISAIRTFECPCSWRYILAMNMRNAWLEPTLPKIHKDVLWLHLYFFRGIPNTSVNKNNLSHWRRYGCFIAAISTCPPPQRKPRFIQCRRVNSHPTLRTTTIHDTIVKLYAFIFNNLNHIVRYHTTTIIYHNDYSFKVTLHSTKDWKCTKLTVWW